MFYLRILSDAVPVEVAVVSAELKESGVRALNLLQMSGNIFHTFDNRVAELSVIVKFNA